MIPFAKIREAVLAAKADDNAGRKMDRNEKARLLFAPRGNRKVAGPDGSYVETWWDRQSRNYITMTCDAKGNEIADADYTGHKDDAAVGHLWALYRYL